MNISPRLQLYADRAAEGLTEEDVRRAKAMWSAATTGGVYDPDPYGFSDPLRGVAPISRAPHRRGYGRRLAPLGEFIVFMVAGIIALSGAASLARMVMEILP